MTTISKDTPPIDIVALTKSTRDFEPNELYRNISRTTIAMSWGINSPIKYKDSLLAFKVQGFLLKGFVFITLAFDDTFTVTFTNRKQQLIETVEGVYIEDLLNIIDTRVEKADTETQKDYEGRVQRYLANTAL